MFRRVDPPVHSQDFLRARDLSGIDKAVAMMPEAGPEFRAAGQREEHTARPTVEVQRQIRAGSPGTYIVNVGITIEHTGKARLDDDGQLQVRAKCLEQRQGGVVSTQSPSDRRRITAIREPDASRSRRFSIVALLRAYSSIRASSTSITGISSRIGYTRLHSTHFRPFSSCFSSTGALQSGQTRISSRSLLMAIVLISLAPGTQSAGIRAQKSRLEGRLADVGVGLT